MNLSKVKTTIATHGRDDRQQCYCDQMEPECVLDACGKRRQKDAQMEERKKNQINKLIRGAQLFNADMMLNTLCNKCL